MISNCPLLGDAAEVLRAFPDFKIKPLFRAAAEMKKQNVVLLVEAEENLILASSVIDEMLDDFCVKEFGPISAATRRLPTAIYRAMPGRPMAELFVQIAKEIYGQAMDLEEGQWTAERFNEVVRPVYINKPAVSGAKELFRFFKNYGLPVYVLTELAPDLVKEALAHKGMSVIYDAVYGAPEAKEENIKKILEKHPEATLCTDIIDELRRTCQ